MKAHCGRNLWIVEVAYGNRPFEVTDENNPQHIQLRTTEELWHKENMVNIAMAHISRQRPDWWAAAWIDADIEFLNPNWLVETWHQLQHYDIVQMFDTCVDLGPYHETLEVHRGFAWCYCTGKPFNAKYGPFWHPGYSWSARRSALDHLGGLIDHSILGAGDHHMALAFINRAELSLPGDIHQNYRDMVMRFQTRAERYIRRNIGFTPGTILHYFHGPKKARKYIERWKILVDDKYNPLVDVSYDSQGLLQLDPENIRLRDDIRAYFRQRNEDTLEDIS